MRKDLIRTQSFRPLKAGELIKHALVEIFSKGKVYSETLLDASITISEVRVSSDLKNATVYVIPLGRSEDKAKFLAALKEAAPVLRKMVTDKVKMRYSPELSFKFDESFDEFSKIEGILKSVTGDSV
jgi:ribosome-binding factor A